jgi:hypothetical protein
MSEAMELYKKDGTAAGVFYCSECRAVFPDQEQAQSCHGERICEKERVKEAERFEAAEKVAYADYKVGMLYDGQDFHEDLESLEDDFFDAPLPPYVWACTDIGVTKASTESLYENMLESMWEDADVHDLNGVDELEAAVAAFNEANKSISVWEPDYSTAILIEKRSGR